MRQFSFVKLLLALLLVVSIHREMRAVLLRNVGMISPLEILASDQDRPIDVEKAVKFL